MSRLDGIRVLVVDDVEDVLYLVATTPRVIGACVDVAATATAGIAKARSGRYDVILMDCQMPDIHGLVVVEVLRREGYTGVILGHSAHAFAANRAEALRRGCDGYITKPANRQELLAAIEAALTGRAAVVQSPVPEVPWLPSNSVPPAKA